MPLVWKTIDLTGTPSPPRLWELAEEAAAAWRRLQRHALERPDDDGAVVEGSRQVGSLLFQAVLAAAPTAFAPVADGLVEPLPREADPVAPATGYHLLLPPPLLELPWGCLHNGVHHLLERAVLSIGPRPLGGGGPNPPSPWQRRRRDLLLSRSLGSLAAAEVLERFRPEACGEPEILVLGHDQGDGELTAQELAVVQDGLAAVTAGRRLARAVPAPAAEPPSRLLRRAAGYQGLHYCGPTASEPALDDPSPLPASLPLATGPDEDELEPVGVDMVTALLDGLEERAAAGRLHRPAAVSTTAAAACWLLPDGPLAPETLAAGGAVPPLVFSNGCCHLTRLGARFLEAGCDLVVAPHLPVPPEGARRFAGLFYRELARGRSAALAWHETARRLRDRGDPTWLRYGLLGDGSLSLLYL